MRTSAFFVCVLALLSACLPSSAVEVSTKNNIGGLFEYAGFTIVPVEDAYVPPEAGDLSSPKAFEIIRPGQQAFSIGRLFTSCTCFRIATDKKVYMTGERAFIALRNVQPTKGQNYPFYVQLTAPVSVVLRHDAFIISDQFAAPAEAEKAEEATEQETPAAPEPMRTPEQKPEPAAEPTPAPEIAETAESVAAAPSVQVAEELPQGEEAYLSDEDLLGN